MAPTVFANGLSVDREVFEEAEQLVLLSERGASPEEASIGGGAIAGEATFSRARYSSSSGNGRGSRRVGCVDGDGEMVEAEAI